jgi:hypothetical protein
MVCCLVNQCIALRIFSSDLNQTKAHQLIAITSAPCLGIEPSKRSFGDSSVPSTQD